MNLFQTGFYKLHSGDFSNLKINCDSLTNEDINTIALQLVQRLPAFSAVEGVPTGGLRLSEAMRKYVRPENELLGTYDTELLIVDDVYTTGASMEAHRADREAIGAVIFARSETPPWITPLFRLEP